MELLVTILLLALCKHCSSVFHMDDIHLPYLFLTAFLYKKHSVTVTPCSYFASAFFTVVIIGPSRKFSLIPLNI